LKTIIISLLSIAYLFSGCASNVNSNITKINEIDYPEGISVIIYNNQLQKDIKINNARLVDTQYKKQLQLVINNINNKNNYNIKLSPEWSDNRGNILLNMTKYKNVKINHNSATRVVLNAPSFKAKNVTINIECGAQCIEK
jgi:uncharacterized protein YcfL